MCLTTEEQGDIRDVTEASMLDVLADDSFGKFAVLSRSDETFIQPGCEWSPSDDCAAFLKLHDSDP